LRTPGHINSSSNYQHTTNNIPGWKLFVMRVGEMGERRNEQETNRKEQGTFFWWDLGLACQGSIKHCRDNGSKTRQHNPPPHRKTPTLHNTKKKREKVYYLCEVRALSRFFRDLIWPACPNEGFLPDMEVARDLTIANGRAIISFLGHISVCVLFLLLRWGSVRGEDVRGSIPVRKKGQHADRVIN
jgi:hypothetical protein